MDLAAAFQLRPRVQELTTSLVCRDLILLDDDSIPDTATVATRQVFNQLNVTNLVRMFIPCRPLVHS